MNIRLTQTKQGRRRRRVTTGAFVALLCLVWTGPIHAACICCESMERATKVVEAETTQESDVPECHRVAAESTTEDTYPSSPAKLTTPCSNECTVELMPPALTADHIASTLQQSPGKTPFKTLSRTLPLDAENVKRLDRIESPPDIAARATSRYAATAPLLT